MQSPLPSHALVVDVSFVQLAPHVVVALGK
jgi:hypothetical protein